MTISERLPTPEEVSSVYPVTQEHRIKERRQAVKDTLVGNDPRLLMIIGPCSAWPSEAVMEYAERLARIQEQIEGQILLVLRTYIQKPRTTVGWPGPLNQPDPLGSVDITRGIWECRKMMHRVGKIFPLADEMLFTHNANYFEPLLAYGAVGARSTEDMEHRYLASGFEPAVGMKNGTSGDIEIGVNSVLSAQSPHVFAYNHHQVTTSGNPHAHLILRGGGKRSNYDPESLAMAMKLMKEKKIANPAIVVDASHDNSMNGHGKDPDLQKIVLNSLLYGKEDKREEYDLVRGVMLESFLKDGAQKITAKTKREEIDMGGLSTTDGCMGWEKTEKLLLKTAERLADIR